MELGTATNKKDLNFNQNPNETNLNWGQQKSSNLQALTASAVSKALIPFSNA